MSTKAPCGHTAVVKQSNYSGSCKGDDWYFRLLWCPECKRHHKLYK